MLTACDCLCYCGDDPGIDRGTVQPCPNFLESARRRRLTDAAPDLLAALLLMEEMFRGHEDTAQDVFIKARAAINKATSRRQ